MSIFYEEYKSNLIRKYTWILLIVILAFMILLAFPIINDPSVQPILEKNIVLVPQGLQNILLPFGTETLTNLNLYFKTIVSHMNLLVCIYALTIGLLSVAKEQGYGTIEYIYNNPISRSSIITFKLIANIISNFTFILILALSSVFIMTYLNDIDFTDGIFTYYNGFIILFFNSIMFTSLGMLISSFNSRTRHLSYINFLVVFLLILVNILYVFNILSIPFISYIPFVDIINLFDLDIINLLVIIGATKVIPTIIFIVLTYLVYGKKDLVI